MAKRFHLFPFRTQQLSSFAPTILGLLDLGKLVNADTRAYEIYALRYSSIAQSVEHAAVNRRVVGSSPTGGASWKPWIKFHGFFLFYTVFLRKIWKNLLTDKIEYVILYVLHDVYNTYTSCNAKSFFAKMCDTSHIRMEHILNGMEGMPCSRLIQCPERLCMSKLFNRWNDLFWPGCFCPADRFLLSEAYRWQILSIPVPF